MPVPTDRWLALHDDRTYDSPCQPQQYSPDLGDPSPPMPMVHATLSDRYRVERELGRGSTAIVYLAVAIAGWRIWVRAPGSVALTLWVVQLGLHLGWIVLFFGLWAPRWAFAEATVLAVVAAATTVTAWPATRLGAALLVPYLGSIGFVVVVNAVIVASN